MTPALYPAILSTGRFTLNPGGNAFQQSSLTSATQRRQGQQTCFGWHGCRPAPSAPHSGSHGQTGVIFSSLCPSALGPSKVGVGVSPQKAFGCQWQAKRSACPTRRLVVFFQEKRQPGGEVLRPAEHVAYGFFVLSLSPPGPRSGTESPRTGPGWPCRLDSASRRWCRPRCCWPRTTAWAPRRRRPRCPRPGS